MVDLTCRSRPRIYRSGWWCPDGWGAEKKMHDHHERVTQHYIIKAKYLNMFFKSKDTHVVQVREFNHNWSSEGSRGGLDGHGQNLGVEDCAVSRGRKKNFSGCSLHSHGGTIFIMLPTCHITTIHNLGAMNVCTDRCASPSDRSLRKL